MAWEDIVERVEGMGWVGVGLGAVILAPALIPAIGRGLRPAAKGAIKGYLSLSERAREMMGESGEQWQDLVAEAKAEYANRTDGSEMMMVEGESGGKAPEEGEEGRSRPRSHHRKEEPATGTA